MSECTPNNHLSHVDETFPNIHFETIGGAYSFKALGQLDCDDPATAFAFYYRDGYASLDLGAPHDRAFVGTTHGRPHNSDLTLAEFDTLFPYLVDKATTYARTRCRWSRPCDGGTSGGAGVGDARRPMSPQGA